MRDVVLFHFLSLDGVAEEPSDWFFDDGPELFELIGQVLETQDDVLLGRGTYDYWVDYWPTSDVEPFASFINTTRKHVATSSRLTGQWNNTVRMTSPVDRLRARSEAAARRRHRHPRQHHARPVADRRPAWSTSCRFVMPPTIAGHGRRLFDADSTDELQQFSLVDVRKSARRARSSCTTDRPSNRSSCGRQVGAVVTPDSHASRVCSVQKTANGAISNASSQKMRLSNSISNDNAAAAPTPAMTMATPRYQAR